MKALSRILALAVVVAGGSLQAQVYSIDWYSIDSGGGTSAGGNYTLTGTIGQPDAGTLSGGNYSLTGGFMSIVTAIQTPGGPLLRVTRSGGNIIISWPNPSTDFVLQETTALASPTVWGPNLNSVTINGADKQITILAPTGRKYFRLRKP